MDVIIEFGKILIPASVVLYAAYLLFALLLRRRLSSKDLRSGAAALKRSYPAASMPMSG